MSDLISRKALCDYALNQKDKSVTPNDIMRFPSAQPEQRVLDKIRAEIEQLTVTKGGDDYVRQMAELFSLKRKVLQIIDKYKAESEG